MKSLSQKLRPQEPFKDFWRPGGSGPAGSYLEPESDLNTCISYKDVLLEDFLVFWYDKMLCFSQKNIFALYLDDPARFAGILCPPGWRYSKNSNSQLCVIPILKKSSSLGSLSFTHRKWDRKNRMGGRSTPPPRPLRVKSYVAQS